MSAISPSLDSGLLQDLLEASDRLYHRNVAIIQRVFAEQFFKVLRERRATDATFPAEDLTPYRHALKAKLVALIAAQRERRAARDANIHAYVAGPTVPQGLAA